LLQQYGKSANDPSPYNRIEIVDPVSYKDWDHLISGMPEKNVFHSSAWATALSRSYGYRPVYFSLFGDTGIDAFLPIMEVRSLLTGCRGVSLPFTDSCDPVAKNQPLFAPLWKRVAEYGKIHDWKFIELRGGESFLPAAVPSLIFFSHTLRLSPDPDRVFSSLTKTTQRAINKAKKENVEVRVSSSLEFLNEFYRLQILTRKRHGLPPQPYRFFKLLHDHVISNSLGLLILAYWKDRCIAGAVCLHSDDKAIYKYAASDFHYQHLRPNNLVMWEAIRYYCLNGFTTFCLGRTEPENTGLRHFKAGWGAREEIIKYFRYDLQTGYFSGGERNLNLLGRRLFTLLPTPLLPLLGYLFYRHAG
jgi:hypothetical protein